MSAARTTFCILTSIAVAGASLLLPHAALAKKEKREKKTGSPEAIGSCVENYKTGLENEQVGHLKQARELFIKCSKASCGSPLRDECTTRFTQLSTDIPSVVPLVTDEAGGPQTDIEVRVDGERLTSTLDGHSFALDPGLREFSFSKDGRVFATQRVMIIQGQRNRMISAGLQGGGGDTKRPAKMAKKGAPALAVAAATEEAPSAPAPVEPVVTKVVPHKSAADSESPVKEKTSQPELNLLSEEHETSHTPALTYALAGTGIAALGAGALLIYWGRKDNSQLSSCSSDTTNCPKGTVDHIRNLYLAGNIGLGVGVASLAAAYWAYAHAQGSGTESSSHEAYRFDLQPTKAGAVASIGGSF
jgi:hypothetical protein